MKEFESPAMCDKCMGTAVKMGLAEAHGAGTNMGFGGSYDYPAEPEHIKVTCERCGHEWDMKTADAGDES